MFDSQFVLNAISVNDNALQFGITATKLIQINISTHPLRF